MNENLAKKSMSDHETNKFIVTPRLDCGIQKNNPNHAAIPRPSMLSRAAIHGESPQPRIPTGRSTGKCFAFSTHASPSILILLFSLLLPTSAFAICPICTIAVGAGIGLSRWLGIDDSVTGLWVGGLIVSLILWTMTWCQKKKIHFTGLYLLIIVGYYALVLLPLRYHGIIGHPFNMLWGIDKILLGTIIGSLVFLGGSFAYFFCKKKNGGKAHFPFEKVAMPIAPLILLSIVFYFITRVHHG
ncbi:MAG: hypothetical protein A2X77_00345 [Gammaproteobacteria bacterium GWE2_42_36]|nr:MAG: hypothetical protein A2X77_00345 [Gammaproteobacteria bacterium GWE2_42_36]HCU05263.1 hypothetical protein [Coxiellaceae bacterium]